MLPQDFFMLELFMIVQSKKLFFIKVFCWGISLLNFYQGRCFCDLQFLCEHEDQVSLTSLELPSSTVIIHIASNPKGLWTQATSSSELKIIGTWSEVASKDSYWCLLKSKNTSHHGQPPNPSNCSLTFAKACLLFDHLNGLPENPRSIRVTRPLEPPKELPKRRSPFFFLFFPRITMKSIKISQTLTDSQVTFLPKQAEICKRYRYSSLKFHILSPESNRYLISQPRWFFTYISKYSSQFL